MNNKNRIIPSVPKEERISFEEGYHNLPKLIIVLFSIILATVIFYSCETTVVSKTIDAKIGGRALEVVEIDSCEYLISGIGHQGYFAHKGNCKFCMKRSKK